MTANPQQQIVHTPGPWSHSEQQGHSRNCFQAQVWDSSGVSLAVVDASNDAAIATADAMLMASAPSLKALVERIYDGVHRGVGPLAKASDMEIGNHIHDEMFNLFGVGWHSVV